LQKMKIAILVPLFPPRWIAGTEIATYSIAKHLAKREYEVHVITSLDKGLTKDSMEEGFYAHRIGFPKVRFLGITIFWLKALFVLKKINPDVVHVQNIGMGIPGFLAKKFLRKPYVVWGQGSEVYFPWLFKKPISKLALKNANAVIALTEDMKEEMQRTCNRDILVIPNGVDLERFENLSRDMMRCQLRARADERLVIFVGRFRLEKGVRYLIEAMETIKQERQSVKLILVGEGPEEAALKLLVGQLDLADCIDFLGQISNEEVPRYMAAADVFALPSLSEGFPIVILEAMASGLPIVATNITGLPEVVHNGENGFLVESKNSIELAEKVLLLLQDNELRGRIAQNNKQRAKDYTWEKVIDRLEQVYQKIVAAL